MKTIYLLIDDKKTGKPVITKTTNDVDYFKKKNKEGYGIYFTVNAFHNGKRTAENIAALRGVYADLDIAKAGDGQSLEQKAEKKEKLKNALLEHLEPTLIIETANGLQPIWKLKNENPNNKETYINILKGIVAWSIKEGSAGDAVYDLARVLRLPNFYHMKEDPFLCKAIHKTDKLYSYEELRTKFPYEEKEKKTEVYNIDKPTDSITLAIDNLDIKDVVIQAFRSIGRTAEFNKNDELVLDGRKTGTFQGRKDDRQYIATSSHEPFKGNKITVVADILTCTNKEARKWIVDTFNLEINEIEKQVAAIKNQKQPEVDKTKRFTWGTRNLDITFAIIKETNFIVLASKRSAGKTTFSFDMALKNARELGHRVSYISLEMNTNDILDDFGRKYAGITIEEEYDHKIPEKKQRAYQKRIDYIKNTNNLTITGIRRSDDIGWEAIQQLILDQKADIAFVDNLDLISGKSNEGDLERQKRITKSIMAFTTEHKIPVVLIHHYRKTAQGTDSGLDDVAGSGKITDNADRVVTIKRTSPRDQNPIERMKSKIELLKGRGYPECSNTIYFKSGTFIDDYPMEEMNHFDQINLKL